MSKQLTLIDPREFKAKDLPRIVFADNMRGFMPGVIKGHSKGNYSHAMAMIEEDVFASQGTMLLRKEPVSKYTKVNYRLKFYRVIFQDQAEEDAFVAAVRKDLAKPWWCRLYDFLGIFGQMVGAHWIQNPWKKYCSEAVASWLRVNKRFQAMVPPHPSPAQLDNIFKAFPSHFKLEGYWFKD